jgi:hypothetical protein
MPVWHLFGTLPSSSHHIRNCVPETGDTDQVHSGSFNTAFDNIGFSFSHLAA